MSVAIICERNPGVGNLHFAQYAVQTLTKFVVTKESETDLLQGEAGDIQPVELAKLLLDISRRGSRTRRARR